MTAKSVLVCPQGLRPRARAPICPPLLRHWQRSIIMLFVAYSKYHQPPGIKTSISNSETNVLSSILIDAQLLCQKAEV